MAGRTLATAYVQLQPSFRGLQKSLDSEGRQAGDQFSKSFERSTSKSLTNFGAKATIGAGLLGAGLLKTAEAAGNLQAALAANEQVLGAASASVQQWARDSVEAVGLSERAALEASTTFALFGEKMGLTGETLGGFSADMVELAADLAAFKDVAPEQVIQDLSSAFAGSTETMTKYGIFLQEAQLKQTLLAETGERVTGVLTPQQRLIATHYALLDQSATMTGQWARESDSLAATQAKAKAEVENAAAAFGEAFLPAAAEAFNLIGDGVGKFADFNGATGGAVAELSVLGVGLLGAAGGVSLVAGKASSAVSKFRSMSTAMQRTTLAAGGITAALTVGYAIWSTYQERQAIAQARIDDATQALVTQTQEAWSNAEAMASAGGAVDGVAVANEALSGSIIDGATHSERFTDALGTLNLTADDAYQVLLAIGTEGTAALRDIALGAGASADEADALAKVVNNVDSGSFFELASYSELAARSLGLSGEEARLFDDDLVVLARAMEEVQDQSEDFSGQIDDIARGFINQQIASKELTPELVAQAEARAGVTRESDDAVDVYVALQEILGEMTAEERAAALGANELAAATDDLATAAGAAGDELGPAVTGMSQMKTVSADTIEVTDELSSKFKMIDDAASSLSTALDRLTGRNLSLQGAEDQLSAATDDLNAAIKDAKKSGDENALSLDGQTAAGRSNREMVRGQIEASYSYAEAIIAAGGSVDEATAAIEANREGLVEQLTQFGLTEAEASDYLDTLGLTPENISTVVDLINDDIARQNVQNLIDNIDEIPKDVATRVQAVIDRGSYDEAWAALRRFEKSIYVPIRVGTVNGGKSYSAWGGYFDGPALTSVAEDHAAEAVLTLEKPGNLRAQLNDPRIRIPIEQALAGGEPLAGGGVSVNMSGPVTIQDATDVDRVAAAINTRLAIV